MADPDVRDTDDSAGDFEELYLLLKPELNSGDLLQRLSSNLSPEGRGRPMKLPDGIRATNRLFLQLGYLKRTSVTVSWAQLSDFAGEVLSLQFGVMLPHLSSLIMRVQREALHIPSDQMPDFLDIERDLSHIMGDFCRRLGISVDMLSNTDGAVLALESIPNGLVLELERFRKEKGFRDTDFQNWLLKLCPSLTDLQLSQKQLRRKVDSLMKMHTRLQKDKGPAHSSLLNQDFSCYVSSSSRPQKVNSNTISSDCAVATTLGVCKQCVVVQKQLQEAEEVSRKMKCKYEEVIREKQVMSANIDGLKETCSMLKEEHGQMKDLLAAANSTITEERSQKATLQKSHAEKTSKYLSLARNANNVKRQQESIDKTKTDLQKLQDETDRLQKSLTSEISLVDEYKRQLRNLEARFTKSTRRESGLREKVYSLQQEVARFSSTDDDTPRPVVLKTEQGHYTPEVQSCVIELMGHEIAANRIGPIIRSVVFHLLHQDIDLNQLPSKSTALRFADMGHALSKFQIAEVLKTQLFDLHLDGTTKDGSKIISHQVTLEDGKQMSLGFTRVDRENTDTLIEMTMQLMHEISSLGSTTDEETEWVLKDIFTHMVSTMTDRAAPMKCYNRMLAELKENMLEDGSGLEQLFCNAHFLLGLASSSEKALSAFEVQEKWKGNLGRDLISSFARFKSSATESAACRLVRTACDILGPRGDEKNGCRDDWLAYLALPHVNKRSAIGSFRSNRFNNLFESAAAVLYHRQDILNFFQHYKEKATVLNLKQRSVLADISCEKVMLMVTALAVAYACVAGPFWMLVQSTVHYLDMYIHVQTMDSQLKVMCDDGIALRHVLQTLPSTLGDFIMEDSEVNSCVQTVAASLSDNVQLQALLKCMAAEYAAVTQRQLFDFLPGGRYGQAPSEQQRKRMAHCKLTNLFGEANFGDLDFSMNKRRNSSLHHHSSVAMSKRNNTMEWLQRKEPERQLQLLSAAKSAGKALRKSHIEHEREQANRAKQRLEERRAEREAKEREVSVRRLNLIQAVHASGGVWTTTAQVRETLASLRSATAKKEAIRQQIQFHRTVLGASDPLLVMASKTLDQLVTTFCDYLLKIGLTSDDPRLPSHQLLHRTGLEDDACDSCEEPPAPKRARLAENHPSSDTSETEADFETHMQATHSPAQFTHQGEKVAVFYDNTFYIGEVLEIHSETQATITFMKGFGKKNAFSWPDTVDLDTVDSQFVFAWDLDMFSTNMRVWCVRNFQSLLSDYAQITKSLR